MLSTLPDPATHSFLLFNFTALFPLCFVLLNFLYPWNVALHSALVFHFNVAKSGRVVSWIQYHGTLACLPGIRVVPEPLVSVNFTTSMRHSPQFQIG